ncbi:MAG: hypothetical protein NVSMB39_7240 [Candidatus Saccharimonadales bacterium]
MFPRHSWQRLSVFSVLLLILLQALILAANSLSAERPVLGLKYEEHSLFFTAPSQMQQLIADDIKSQEAHPLTVAAGKFEGHITARQLGARYSKESAYRQVMSFGRQGVWVQRVLEQDRALFGAKDIILGYPNIQKDVAEQYFSYIASKANEPAVDAIFLLEAGKVSVREGSAGRHLEADRSFDAVRGYKFDGAGQLKLPMTPDEPKFTQKDLSPLQAEVQNIAGQPLQLVADGQKVTVESKELLTMVSAVRAPDPAKPAQTMVKLELQDKALSGPLDRVSALAARDPKPKIVSGRLVVDAGQAGVHIDGIHAKVALATELASRQLLHASHPEVALPTEKVEPPVVSQAPSATPIGKFPAYAKGSGAVTLTFDDGPNNTFTGPILDILKQYGVHAIFFSVGRNVNAYPEMTRRIAAEGHTLGNHSFTHAQLSRLPLTAVAQELDTTQQAISRAAAITPNLFRPPYGDSTLTINNLAASRGLQTMMWSVDPRDWAQPGPAVIAQRVVGGAVPGSNILLHVLHRQTVDALPAIIEGLRQRGFIIN